MPQIFNHDPGATLDYQIDWSLWLGAADTIATSTWSAWLGITIDSNSFTNTRTTVWISGGTVGRSYQLTNTITTANGRTDERTITLQVLQR